MIKRLLYLNGLAVLTVILYHATAWGYISMFWWTDRYRAVSVPNFDFLYGPVYFGLRVIEQLIIYGIPTFLFVSGFFIAISAGRTQKTVNWKLVFGRIKNLFIPFLLWSIAILVLRFLQGERLSLPVLLRTILLGQTTEAYYFVPVLIQLYLISPFLVPIARNRWKSLLLVTGLLQLFVLALRYITILNIDIGSFAPLIFLTRNWFFIGYTFFFSLGIVLGFHLEEFKQFLFRYRWWFVTGMLVFFIAGFLEWEWLLKTSGENWIGPRETIIDQFYALSFLLTFLGFENISWPFNQQMSYIGMRSYGIYLAHSPILEYSSRLVYNLAPGLLAYQLAFQPLLWALALGIPLLLMEILNRTPARRYYNFVFG